MHPIEAELRNFQGGNERSLERRDFIELFSDAFDTLLYKYLQLKRAPAKVDNTYTSNEAFWHDALKRRLFEGQRILLRGFHLTEWLPSAPGRYFTDQAAHERDAAEMALSWSGQNEYLPLGKVKMILGGVGSLRLASKVVGARAVHLLGASATGVSHQGIPVAIAEADYRVIVKSLKEYGGCVANLAGALRILPTAASVIQFDRKVPRLCLLVDDFEVVRVSAPSELLTTVAVMFPSLVSKESDIYVQDGYPTHFKKSWSFCSFHPEAGEESLDRAVDWLKDYVSRYSGMENPPILGDFDELQSHFEAPTEFPLSRMFRGGPDVQRLAAYGDYYNLTVNLEGVLVMGDSFSNISNSTIVTRGAINAAEGAIVQGVNTLNQQGQNDVAKAIAELQALISKAPDDALPAEQKKENLEVLRGVVEEAAKPSPNKSILKSLGGTLWDAIKFVPAIAAGAKDLWPVITKLWQ